MVYNLASPNHNDSICDRLLTMQIKNVIVDKRYFKMKN
ncbi:hypothetical protein GVAMD_0278 [Gardnerella vaginalis AMD]|nr:hypothetical protein GVAMD_0278 [Gardnerella vaginalis AMD]